MMNPALRPEDWSLLEAWQRQAAAEERTYGEADRRDGNPYFCGAKLRRQSLDRILAALRATPDQLSSSSEG
jgi:hypothetical protein